MQFDVIKRDGYCEGAIINFELVVFVHDSEVFLLMGLEVIAMVTSPVLERLHK
jgi:hypothetical protein